MGLSTQKRHGTTQQDSHLLMDLLMDHNNHIQQSLKAASFYQNQRDLEHVLNKT